MGGGNGGFAAAADLTLRGFEVTLYEDPKFADSIAGIREDRTIHLEGVGPVGTATLRKVTTDLADAVSDVDLIMPISPAFAQEAVAKSLIPHLKEGMVIFLNPGSCGGGLVYGKIFHEAGVFQKVKLCEVNTLPYATRKINENTVRILLRDPVIWFSAFPAKYNQELYELVKPLYSSITLMHDVLETALNNGNIAFCGTASELTDRVGRKYFIHIKTQQGDNTFETDNIEDTLISLLGELKQKKIHVLDIKVDRGTLEQHFIEMARREAE